MTLGASSRRRGRSEDDDVDERVVAAPTNGGSTMRPERRRRSARRWWTGDRTRRASALSREFPLPVPGHTALTVLTAVVEHFDLHVAPRRR